jgi:hypothetical protein
MDVLEQADQLRREACELLATAGVLSILQDVGTPRVVGSVDLDLMTPTLHLPARSTYPHFPTWCRLPVVVNCPTGS